ncbi:MAG: serine acetyltransferase [Coleofasciculaceae cyanobacterium SM2_3_26]|nr:serine acetyltransferase [Coleofasciculaceae cyanobacterium SM2_3_26]
MKSQIRNAFESLNHLLFSPLLVLFWLTTEKTTILADVQRWVDVFEWKHSPVGHLLKLLARQPEFRNLYYHRIFRGSAIARFLMYLLQVIYKPFPMLFIDTSSNIGAGLFIQHGFSTIIMADMGENCWINQQVSIGYKDKSGRPKIGDNVRITAGAKVLGNITIGDNCVIGANAVVVKNVPGNCVVVGIPAYIIQRDGVKVREELV